MLDADTDAIMHARYIADQVRLGKRTLSAKERSALAMGFDVCDRQRAEFARELQARRAADLTSEDVEALRYAHEHIEPGNAHPKQDEIDIYRRALILLDRLSTEKP